MDGSSDLVGNHAGVAAYLDSQRERVLRDIRIAVPGEPLPGDGESPGVIEQSHFVNAVVDDVVASLREFPISRIDEDITHCSWPAPAGGGRAEVREGDGWIAYLPAVLFKVVLLLLVSRISDDSGPETAQFCAFSAITLNRSVLRRSRELLAIRPCRTPTAHAEDENRRIVRDLHDRTGNDIAAAISALECADDEAGRARAVALMRNALCNVRRTIGTLCPAPLDLDLNASLREYLEASGPGGANVQVRMAGDQATVPARMRDELFLIVREAVRNAIRHAGAQAITIDITIGAGDVHVVVADDGAGLEPARIRRAVRGGLATMRERARSLNGTIEIIGGPGEGTAVHIRAPLPGRAG